MARSPLAVWLGWTLTTTFGVVLGVLSILLVFSYVLFVWPAIGAILGVFVGGAQALGIKWIFASRIDTTNSSPQQWSLHWLGKTTLAFAFLWPLTVLLWLGSAFLFPKLGASAPSTHILAFANALMAGGLLSIFQRDLLTQLLHSSVGWLAANITGACAFTLIVLIANPWRFQPSAYLQIGEAVFYSVDPWMLGVITLGALVFGAITGVPLTRWSLNTNSLDPQLT